MGYHALSGRYPFEAPSIGRLILMHQKERPEPLATLNPAVPAPLAAVIEKALLADREQRYQTMIELREAVQSALEQMGSERQDSSQPSLATGAGGESMPPTVIEGKERGTTTLSSSVGEQASVSDGPEKPRPVIPLAAGTAVVVGLAVVLFIALRSRNADAPAPGPARPTLAATRPAAALDSAPPAPGTTAPKRAKIQLVLSPASARVLLDGEETDDNPLTLEVGEHTIKATAPGHEPLEKKLTVAGDRTLRLELERVRKPAPKARKPRPKGKRAREKPAAKMPAAKTKIKTKTKKKRKPFFDDL
jgi:hypothetical protein